MRLRHIDAHAQRRAICLVLAIALLLSCGKADRSQVESAIMASIYEDRTLFDTLCGFPIEPFSSPRVQILEAEGDALPWLGLVSDQPARGTARLRLTEVVRKGETTERTCEARVSFLWQESKHAYYEQNRKYVRTTSTFHATGFTKLAEAHTETR